MKRKEKILEISTIIFLFFLPLFSTVFFHNRITTLVEVIIIILILLGTLIVYKESRKNFKWLFSYYIICFLYFILNYFHSFAFYSLVPNNFNYSPFNEFLTIVKLIMPITFMYSLYYQKINYKNYIKVLKIWVIMISGSIIITNIFKVSLGSYSNDFITLNIFEWRSSSYYQATASKGFFMYANQISLWLLLILVIFLYEYINGNKKVNKYIIMLTISMVMIGTRISTYGIVLSIVLMFLISKIIFHKKYNVVFLIFLIIMWTSLYFISPCYNRSKELSNIHENYDSGKDRDSYIKRLLNKYLNSDEKNNMDITNETDDKEETKLSEKMQYVYDNYNKNYLPSRFFEDIYPMKYDEDFWFNFVKNNPSYTLTYRYIEKSIIERVIEISDNNWNILFGISNSRIQNIVNVERDFLLHFYAYGIVGSIILLCFYLILIILSIKKIYVKKNFISFTTYLILMLFISSSYLTGNIINSINIIIPFTFIINIPFNKEMLDYH